MKPAQINEAANELERASAERQAIAPLTSTWPAIKVEDAYAVQLANIKKRVDAGRVVRGYKIGLTAKSVQQALGVHEPDYGHLMDDMFLETNGNCSVETLIAPRAEIEIAFVLGRDLPIQGCIFSDILRATEYVTPAIEIIDSRIADWKIKIEDTVSDNASSAAVVLGSKATPVSSLDLSLEGAVLWQNSSMVEFGAGAAALGHPVNAVAWLANMLGGFGIQMREGDVILSGACTKPVPVSSGDMVRGQFTNLGDVSVTFVS